MLALIWPRLTAVQFESNAFSQESDYRYLNHIGHHGLVEAVWLYLLNLVRLPKLVNPFKLIRVTASYFDERSGNTTCAGFGAKMEEFTFNRVNVEEVVRCRILLPFAYGVIHVLNEFSRSRNVIRILIYLDTEVYFGNGWLSVGQQCSELNLSRLFFHARICVNLAFVVFNIRFQTYYRISRRYGPIKRRSFQMSCIQGRVRLPRPLMLPPLRNQRSEEIRPNVANFFQGFTQQPQQQFQPPLQLQISQQEFQPALQPQISQQPFEPVHQPQPPQQQFHSVHQPQPAQQQLFQMQKQQQSLVQLRQPFTHPYIQSSPHLFMQQQQLQRPTASLLPDPLTRPLIMSQSNPASPSHSRNVVSQSSFPEILPWSCTYRPKWSKGFLRLLIVSYSNRFSM